jgi:tuberous sclerosis protein 2
VKFQGILTDRNKSFLFPGKGQAKSELDILKNRFGSMRYAQFLKNLGTLVAIKGAKKNNLFINLDEEQNSGKFTYVWTDEIIQVTFHVATLM